MFKKEKEMNNGNKIIHKKIGLYLKSKRKELKIPMRVLSETLNIHPNAIYKFENGDTDMTVSRVVAIARFLGVGGSDLEKAVNGKWRDI